MKVKIGGKNNMKLHDLYSFLLLLLVLAGGTDFA